MLLGPVFKSLGIPPLPLFAIPQKGEYIWKDLARQADIEHSARQAGYYIAGIYREKANTRSWTAR